MSITSTAGIGGSIPQMNRTGEVPGSAPLFHSVRDIALIIDKTVKAGYGVLKAGTLMAVNTGETDGADYGKLVPYPEDAVTANAANAKAYVIAQPANSSAVVYVTVADSYKFALGDHLIVDTADVAQQNLGEITEIDRTDTNSTRAKITATTNLSDSGGNFTLAKNTCVYVKGNDSSAPFTKAQYVLDRDIDTGTGEDAVGAVSSIVINNAVLYKNSIVNYDSAALTDLGGAVDGRFLILK